MSRSSLSSVVFRKELRETLRDKRVILGVVISPLLVTPLLLATILFFAGKKELDKKSATLEVGLVEAEPFPELLEELQSKASVKIHRFDTRQDAENAIEGRVVRAALIVPQDARSEFLANRSASLEVLYNFANESSQNTHSRLLDILKQFDKETVSSRIQNHSLPKDFAKPTSVTSTNIASGESSGSFVLGVFLPYLIVISAAFGGIQTAFDLCAGEKERGTMETLLVSPASRPEIVRGKLLTVFVISLIASLCAITGIMVPISLGLEFANKAIGAEISFSVASLLGMLLIVVPLALFTSSLLLVISSFARNQKEAQTYIFPFISIVFLPAMLSSILGAETQLYTALIPVLNISLTMKQILSSVFDPVYFALSLASSFLYAFLAMRLATALFQREQILFRA